jgi:hypothetical protein
MTSTPAPTPDSEVIPVKMWDNPCEAYRRYRKSYDDLITGEKIARTEYHGNGQERHLEFSVASIPRLKAEMDAAYDACMAQNGGPPRIKRFALVAGARPERFTR